MAAIAAHRERGTMRLLVVRDVRLFGARDRECLECADTPGIILTKALQRQ
jgi:hypothetical protein